MKKIMSVVILLAIFMTSASLAYADAVPPSGIPVDYIGERTVEVDTYEDFLHYPKDPQYKYTFFIKYPPVAQPRNSICYDCGRPYYTITNYRTVQSTTWPVLCPGTYGSSLLPDIFATWNNYYDEKCNYCGLLNTIRTDDTYTSYCKNDSLDSEYEVRKEWTLENGHDIHEVYDYWIDPEGFWDKYTRSFLNFKY